MIDESAGCDAASHPAALDDTPPGSRRNAQVSARGKAALEAVAGRDVAALQDPRPVNLIGACSAEGEVCFATVIWVTPASHKPPLLAFALRAKSRTMQIIREESAFSCCTLPATPEAVELAKFCGGNTGKLIDKGSRVPHSLVGIQGSAVPIPELAYSWTACTVESIQEAGDHLLVIGTVQEARIDARCPRDAHGQLLPAETLLCVQHGCYARAETL